MRVQLSGLLIGALLLASCDPTSPTTNTGGGSTGGGGSTHASRLIAVTTVLQTGVAGTNAPTTPIVKAVDANNLGVDGVEITWTVTANNGSIQNISSITAGGGLASVGVWSLDAGIKTDTLVATADSIPSALIRFRVNGIADNPAKLVVVGQPGDGSADVNIAPTVTVQLQDAQGHNVGGAGTNVTIGITPGTGAAGATLIGTKTRAVDVNGLATFTGLRIKNAGTGYTLTATATNLVSAVTAPFDITPGATRVLVWSAQPTPVVAGATISPALQVSVQDTMGNVITTSSAVINLTIGTNPGAGVLSGTASKSATAGVAFFSNLSINKPGTGYTLNASAPSLSISNVASTPFDVQVGAAAQLALSAGPSNAAAGATLSSLTVQIQDALGNPVPQGGVNITAGITAGSGALGAMLAGTRTQATNGSGLATFNNLSIAKAGTAYSLTISASGFASQLSGLFDISTGAATQAVFTVQPISATAGIDISPSVVVQIQDALGNLITTSSQSVSIAITAGSGNPLGLLNGTVTRSAIGGIATFPGLKINEAGSAYSFTATAGALTQAVSSSFDISPAAPAQMLVTTNPATTGAGATLANTTVGVQDAFGNTVVTAGIPITIGITAGTGNPLATLSGTKLKLTNATGTVVFNNLSIGKSGTGYTLTATSPSLISVATSAFDITPGVAATLGFTASPASATSGVAFSPSVTVQIQDAAGNLVTGATNNVTIAITSPPAGAVLSGTVTKAAVGGIASFSANSINQAGSGYTLTATAAGLSSAVSTAFDVSPGAPNNLTFTTGPTTVALGNVMAPSVVVQVRDANNNVVPTSTDLVTISVTVGSGTVVGVNVGGTPAKLPTAGILTYNDLTFDHSGTSFTLTASAPGLTSAVSGTFDVTDPGYIYFSRFSGGSYDVWRMTPDGLNQTQITSRLMAGDPAPAKNSANGKVAFSDGSYGIQKLYVMNADGSTQQFVETHSDAGEAAWSPDGSTIASRIWAGSPSFGAFTIGGDGSSRTQLSGAVDNYPSWSNDGQFIALAHNVSTHSQLVTMSATGGTPVILLTTDTAGSNVLLQQGDSLFGFQVDTGFMTFPENITSFKHTAWSPDGMRVAFVIQVGTEQHIGVISNTGGAAVVILTDPVHFGNPFPISAVHDLAPTWSPDGTKIYFQSDESGSMQIWSMNADGSNRQQLTNTGTNFSPSWWN